MPTPRRPLPSRRRFLQCGAAAALAGLGTAAYTWRVEPHWVEVVRRPLPIAHLPADLRGRLLVQLSDLHIGPEVDDGYLLDCFSLVADLDPDILVITGDFMTCRKGEQLAHALRVLERLPLARLATLAVPGNHDYGMPACHADVADRLGAGLADLGVAVLRNSSRTVAGLTVAGLDDLWGPNFDPFEVLPELDPWQANLVLCHNPDAVDLPVWSGYRGWILSGHTHGGQCKPPFLTPPCLPLRNRRYWAGEFDLGDGRRLYVNRALGHLLRVRFNVRPEITAFRLERTGGSPHPPDSCLLAPPAVGARVLSGAGGPSSQPGRSGATTGGDFPPPTGLVPGGARWRTQEAASLAGQGRSGHSGEQRACGRAPRPGRQAPPAWQR